MQIIKTITVLVKNKHTQQHVKRIAAQLKLRKHVKCNANNTHVIIRIKSAQQLIIQQQAQKMLQQLKQQYLASASK